MARRGKRKRRIDNRRPHLPPPAIGEPDGAFAFIAGYTEGGAPFGVTWEEMDDDPDIPDADLDLPF